jgi:hypothetical protein
VPEAGLVPPFPAAEQKHAVPAVPYPASADALARAAAAAGWASLWSAAAPEVEQPSPSQVAPAGSSSRPRPPPLQLFHPPFRAETSATRRYKEHHYLNYGDTTIDGFVDAGRGGQLWRESIVVGDPFDLMLSQFVERVRETVQPERDLSKRMLMIAEAVVTALGGVRQMSAQPEIDEKVRQLTDWNGELPIGQLIGQKGACRHRAILFKYLADHSVIDPVGWGTPAVRARLVRAVRRGSARVECGGVRAQPSRA